ncbi:MAG: rhodanese-related sulfurtransferase [Chloroflexi bacterium]|nr:MAG: rhodanese-related sulfurtransferase [Chloroflexota bacterium]
MPEISVQEVAQKLARGDQFYLIDVREPAELLYATLGDEPLLVPMSLLAEQGIAALPEVVRQNKTAEIVVFCHHGVRSAQVVAWMQHHGWQNVFSMAGGIDAYAVQVDPKIGRY